MSGVLDTHPLPWRVAKSGERIRMAHWDDSQAEADCIVDANNLEVIGSSEWMRGEENLPFIVECVNASKS